MGPLQEISGGGFIPGGEVAGDTGGVIALGERNELVKKSLGGGVPFHAGHDSSALAQFGAQRAFAGVCALCHAPSVGRLVR